MISKGSGTPKDDFEARYWIAKAASQGNSNAHFTFQLHYSFERYRDIPIDKEADMWFENVIARITPLSRYSHSKNGKKNRPIRSDAIAQYNLSIVYYTGRHGVSKDYEESFYWAMKAAKNGSEAAQLLLSIMYLNGESVEQNFQTSLTWHEIAIANGLNINGTDTSIPYDAIYKKYLSAEQRNEAKKSRHRMASGTQY